MYWSTANSNRLIN